MTIRTNANTNHNDNYRSCIVISTNLNYDHKLSENGIQKNDTASTIDDIIIKTLGMNSNSDLGVILYNNYFECMFEFKLAYNNM